MKDKCKNCGHLTYIMDDDGKKIFCCSAVKLIFDEMEARMSVGEKSFEFEAVDHTFRLNERDDCFMWVQQTEEQKKLLKKSEKSFFKKKSSF